MPRPAPSPTLFGKGGREELGEVVGRAIGGAGDLGAAAETVRQPLATVAVAGVVFAAAHLTGANEFLAAFAAGVAVNSLGDRPTTEATQLDVHLAELLKLAALFAFGTLLSPEFFAGFSPGDYGFVLIALVLARPLALAAALAGSGLTRREWVAAAWFGPKGFASVVYALLVLDAGLRTSQEVFHLAGAVVALSIVVHSSTDVVVARWFKEGTGDVEERVGEATGADAAR